MREVIEEYQGDLWEWDLSVAGVDEATGEEAPYDLTGVTVLSTIKRDLDDEDAAAVLQVEATTHTDPAAGETVLSIPSADTSAIPLGVYHVDIKLLPGPHTLWVGRLEVKRSSTRRTS